MQAREQHGQPQDEYSYSAVITAASRAGDQVTVRQAFADAAAASLANAAVCNAAIEALSRAGDTAVSLAGFFPTTVAIQGCLHACGCAALVYSSSNVTPTMVCRERWPSWSSACRSWAWRRT